MLYIFGVTHCFFCDVKTTHTHTHTHHLYSDLNFVLLTVATLETGFRLPFVSCVSKTQLALALYTIKLMWIGYGM